MAAAIFREMVGAGAPHAARAVGIASWAARRVTTRDLAWANVVAVMEPRHLAEIQGHWPDHARKVRVLGVPDNYDPGEPDLRELLMGKVKALLAELAPDGPSGSSGGPPKRPRKG